MFHYHHLDGRTRGLMLAEVACDEAQGTLYLSDRLSPIGRQDYPGLLRTAIESFDIAWLAGQLRCGGRMNATLLRRKPTGGYSSARMPVNAPDTLAAGEFNRLYARAVCLRAIEDGVPTLVVYRAKQVEQPRPQSEALIGTHLDAQALLNDLRTRQGTDTEHHMPGGPNSGLSVRLP